MKIDVKNVAKLANLPLKDTEIPVFEKQLDEILDYFKVLEKLDLSKVTETSQVTGLTNVTRKDIASDSLTQEQALQNAPVTENGFIKVTAILDKG